MLIYAPSSEARSATNKTVNGPLCAAVQTARRS